MKIILGKRGSVNFAGENVDLIKKELSKWKNDPSRIEIGKG